MKTILLIIFSSLLLSACTPSVSKTQNNYKITDITVAPTKMDNTTPSPQAANLTAIINTTKGTIKVNLLPEVAPNTVQNFVDLAKGRKINPNTNQKVSDKPFYDGVIFHRVISGFMIQGGDPQGDGRGGPGYRFADEPVRDSYTRGTMAMANAGPNTNGSQFFIMHKDYPLSPQYTIFGRIDPNDEASFKTLDAIAQTPTDSNDKPLENIVINTVEIIAQ